MAVAPAVVSSLAVLGALLLVVDLVLMRMLDKLVRGMRRLARYQKQGCGVVSGQAFEQLQLAHIMRRSTSSDPRDSPRVCPRPASHQLAALKSASHVWLDLLCRNALS